MLDNGSSHAGGSSSSEVKGGNRAPLHETVQELIDECKENPDDTELLHRSAVHALRTHALDYIKPRQPLRAVRFCSLAVPGGVDTPSPRARLCRSIRRLRQIGGDAGPLDIWCTRMQSTELMQMANDAMNDASDDAESLEEAIQLLTLSFREHPIYADSQARARACRLPGPAACRSYLDRVA